MDLDLTQINPFENRIIFTGEDHLKKVMETEQDFLREWFLDLGYKEENLVNLYAEFAKLQKEFNGF